MSFNLLTDPFLPVRTREGGIEVLTLTDLPTAADALEPAWPRADFNAAAMELLIGIAALALRPPDADEWADIWEEPPTDWAERLAEIAPAFDVLGDGPRFLQEHGGLDGAPVAIEALLIDTPGANGQKKNADLLTHRARYPALGVPAAAMASQPNLECALCELTPKRNSRGLVYHVIACLPSTWSGRPLPGPDSPDTFGASH